MHRRLLVCSAALVLVLASAMLVSPLLYGYLTEEYTLAGYQAYVMKIFTDYGNPQLTLYHAEDVCHGWGFVPIKGAWVKVYSILWKAEDEDAYVDVKWSENGTLGHVEYGVWQPVIPQYATNVYIILSRYMYDKLGTIKISIDIYMKPEYAEHLNELMKQITGKTLDEMITETSVFLQALLATTAGISMAAGDIAGLLSGMFLSLGGSYSAKMFINTIYHPYHYEVTFSGDHYKPGTDYVVIKLPSYAVNLLRSPFYQLSWSFEYKSKAKECSFFGLICHKNHDGIISAQPGIGILVESES